jgi:hypothetical protein
MLFPTPAPTELLELLHSDAWPAALEPQLYCDEGSESDEIIKADGILELVLADFISGAKVLDFGCGSGYLPMRAATQFGARFAIGYDIVDSFAERCKPFCTTNLERIAAGAPYDLIIANDVIDHLEGSTIVQTMRSISELTARSGRIFVRCHPFCSRHATHLFKVINKAFIHLIFSPRELAMLGFRGLPHLRTLLPRLDYRRDFTRAGLIWEEEFIVRDEVEDFFMTNPLLAPRLLRAFRGTVETVKPQHLEVQLVDYILRRR